MHLDQLLTTASALQRSQDHHMDAQPRIAYHLPLPSLMHDGGGRIASGHSGNAHHDQQQYEYRSPNQSPADDYAPATFLPEHRSPTRLLPSLQHQPQSSFLAPLHITPALSSHHDTLSTPVHQWTHSGYRPHHAFLPSIHVKEEPSRNMHSSVINASAIQRRLAIERRNLKRNIVPRNHGSSVAAAAEKTALLHSIIVADAKNTKNRESAAAYREKRDRKMKLILAEIHQIQAAHPSIEFRDWTPAKLAKSERKPDESKEDYRRRTNRESAAGSREQQKEKLHYLTQELVRMRALVPTESEPSS
ncbi:hypothetical protein LEN26_013340 [Aphanomyces euteiches]|uniref:Uncharacterized protein n=1 Tax=Aphanomyces euteiches TaxID=100861 RepID=A0A6G0XFY8_9STRA|nr:hypothetical protein Ae201684_005259 [Aphanomyces euteiches]KAH9053493.1 hypothetical protein Ae201684P_015260 [Aphanomyces euteiches]KAH9104764.1 hypothetical protein AeMF1_019287 [Aphanomyces euteiches]KAH9111987.1 hypothetical protein LEN26_013340 [Aphanomyces euteiches]KAH9112263.1 hypothetical protein AeMF1_013340 [Aphanomyces euteiches]